MKYPIPTNIITGFLGAGKTTAILELLAQHSDDELWAVLINEFGQVDIDAAWIRGQNPEKSFTINEVKGGCICCSAGITMQVAVTRLLREVKPARLLIEPTGVAQLSSLLKILQNQYLTQAIALQAVICLVDPRQFSPELLDRSEVYRDQLNHSDIIVLNKCDLASSEQLYELTAFLTTLPTQPLIFQTEYGKLARDWLDVSMRSSLPQLEKLLMLAHELTEPQNLSSITCLEIQRLEAQQDNRKTCGWIFPENYRFEMESLLKFFKYLAELPIARAKGIFRMNATQAQLFNQVAGQFQIHPVTHHTDSRIELIAEENTVPDWKQLEELLYMSCVQVSSSKRQYSCNHAK